MSAADSSPAKSTSADPTPAHPESTEPTRVVPTSVESTPDHPESAKPTPVESTPTKPAHPPSAHPTPAESTLGDPAPAESAPAAPTPAESTSADPAPAAADSGTPIGIDTGGTFTDVAVYHAGQSPRIEVFKVPSTPHDPGQAVLGGLADARRQLADPFADIIHGTTVGLNAILTGRLARVAWVTNAGFEDLIEIGRQQRDDLYALEPTKSVVPVPRELRFGIATRRGVDGQRLATPTSQDLEALRNAVAAAKPDAIAIGLLHAAAHPEDERELAKALAPLGVPITCSAGLLPRDGEYERFAATVLNAGIHRSVGNYLAELGASIAPGRLRLMRSSGGVMPLAEAIEYPARAVFSGPAGGVVATARLADHLGLDALAAFDMGGTSTDVCLVRRHHPTPPDAERRIAGLPLPLPAVDVHTVGCGGGSIAYRDAGGALRVGPRSAGAAPGPACYGRGTEPTVTDAHMALGHMGADTLLGGAFPVDPDASVRAIERLGDSLGLDVERTARGILEIAETEMLRALLVITVERAVDPADIALCAYGGAGGLHAAALARRLGMREAIVAPEPGAFSAVGLALAGESTEHIVPVQRPWSAAVADELDHRSQAHRAAADPSGATTSARVVLRYSGQGGGLALRFVSRATDLPDRFADAHEDQFGFRLRLPIEVVELRLRTETPGRPWPHHFGKQSPHPSRGAPPPASQPATRRRRVGPDWHIVQRDSLAENWQAAGPLLIEETTGVTVVPSECEATVQSGCLRIRQRDPVTKV